MSTDNTIEYYKGDDKTIGVTVYSNGNTTNITGCSFKFTVKKYPVQADTYALITKSTVLESEISLTTPVSGELEIYLVPSDAINSKADKYYYDIEMTDSNNKVHTIIKDTFLLLEDVSKG